MEKDWGVNALLPRVGSDVPKVTAQRDYGLERTGVLVRGTTLNGY